MKEYKTGGACVRMTFDLRQRLGWINLFSDGIRAYGFVNVMQYIILDTFNSHKPIVAPPSGKGE
jgi:hypothetical protein